MGFNDGGAARQKTREGASATGMARNYAQQNRHRCPEGLVVGLMKRTIDDLPLVRVADLVARGDIRRDAKTASVRFGDDEVEYQVGVKVRRFRNSGFWAMLVCPRCGGSAQRLRLLDDRPACGKCVRASGLIHRSQSVRTEKRHTVTAPPRLARLNSDRPLRIHPRPGRTFDGRASIEFALRQSRIVARKHCVDRAKDQGFHHGAAGQAGSSNPSRIWTSSSSPRRSFATTPMSATQRARSAFRAAICASWCWSINAWRTPRSKPSS